MSNGIPQQCGPVRMYDAQGYAGTAWHCWPYHPGAQFTWAIASIPLSAIAGITLVLLTLVYFRRTQR